MLRAMEEAGRARRGYFVDGRGGSRSALPGAVDRLRAARDNDRIIVALAATDPAKPVLSRPAVAGRLGQRLRRGGRLRPAAGAYVSTVRPI